MAADPNVPFKLDLPAALSLGLVFSFLPLAQTAASLSLPKTVSRKHYWLFVWCAYDVLTHTLVEGSFLYHCFFSFLALPVPTADWPHPASRGGGSSGIVPGPFLGRADRLYGAWYSDAPMARLWQEYAKADRRWGGADLTVISLELLTVFGAGPAALYVCVLLSRATNSGAGTRTAAALEAKVWWVATVLSTAELYGGFMTFAPEWLSANTLLAGDDPVYLWLYLVFFNMLWVFIPLWILWESWREMGAAFVRGASVAQVKKVT